MCQIIMHLSFNEKLWKKGDFTLVKSIKIVKMNGDGKSPIAILRDMGQN